MAGQQTRGSRRAGRADTSSGEPTKSDLAGQSRERRQRDAPLERAFEAGRRGDDPAEYQTDNEAWGYYQDGARLAKTEARGARRDELTSAAGAKAGSVASDGAGFILGVIGYALLAIYLRHGVPGVRSWISAKFINKPTVGTSTAAAKPATPARPTPAPRSSSGVKGAVG